MATACSKDRSVTIKTRRKVGGIAHREDSDQSLKTLAGRLAHNVRRALYDRCMLRAASVVFWLALLAWFALSIVGGLAAMAIFPAARELPISMQGYEAFLAAEPVMGRQLVAGYLVERVFEVALQPRYVLAAITVAAFVTQLILARGEKHTETLRRTRIAVLACAVVALLVGSVLLVGFRVADKKYRALAGTESFIAEAIATKPLVDAAHENASRAATAEVLALLTLAGLTAAAAASTAGGRRA